MTDAAPATASERARALLVGATDLHVHAAPDPYAERRMDARALVQAAAAAGMSGVVLKSHEYPTAPLAWAVREAAPGLAVHGALSLDHAVGGLNRDAVEVSLRLGARVVWMPTFDAAHWREVVPRMVHSAAPGIRVVDGDGALLPGVHEILDLVAEHGAVLASGHLSTAETLALVRASRQRAIPTVITHASMWIEVEAQRALAALGARIEQCANVALGPDGARTLALVLDQVRAVGARHVVLSTDLGQARNPDPVDGFAWWIDRFLEAGFSEADVTAMTADTPRALLAGGG